MQRTKVQRQEQPAIDVLSCVANGLVKHGVFTLASDARFVDARTPVKVICKKNDHTVYDNILRVCSMASCPTCDTNTREIAAAQVTYDTLIRAGFRPMPKPTNQYVAPGSIYALCPQYHTTTVSIDPQTGRPLCNICRYYYDTVASTLDHQIKLGKIEIGLEQYHPGYSERQIEAVIVLSQGFDAAPPFVLRPADGVTLDATERSTNHTFLEWATQQDNVYGRLLKTLVSSRQPVPTISTSVGSMESWVGDGGYTTHQGYTPPKKQSWLDKCTAYFTQHFNSPENDQDEHLY